MKSFALFSISLLFSETLCVALKNLDDISCSVSPDRRTDCGYIGSTKDDCERKGCCWSPTELKDVPWCFHRDGNACRGYSASDISRSSNTVKADLTFKGGCRVYGPDVKSLAMTVEYETDTRVHVKITDREKARFEVPEDLFPRPSKSPDVTGESAAYEFELQENPMSFKVVRKSDGEALFDTSSTGGSSFINPLIYEEQYLEISTRIPNDANIYGLGEVVHSLRRDSQWTRQTMWSRDTPTPKDQNVYGVHPFYMEMRNGKAHGVLLLNSNGMDVLIRPGAITYKVIGGILDFYIFVGPTPADVIHQYQQVVGYPHMIPYWVLGFHQCRYGYKNLDEVKEVVRRYRQAEIPLDTMWTDIDYMDAYKDFTVDPQNYPEDKMREFISDLHKNDQKYVLILDPAIKAQYGYEPYEQGLKQGIFIKKPDGQPLIGKVWPGLTAFPDFVNPKTLDYWTKYIREFMQKVPVDGWWIDMNEPASFCDGHCAEFETINSNDDQKIFSVSSSNFDPNNPSYKINNGGWEAPLRWKTVSPDALHYNNTLHYDLHNLYGHSEAIMTRKSLLQINPKQRPFVLSRSTFPGSGVHAGHWTGDNWSTWEHLYLSIPAVLNFQLFGIPLVGADICGFIGNVQEELCARWMQLGAFYPFSRNHNTVDARPQEPYLWDSVAKASRQALSIRYSILPLYYTLFYQAHKFGSTVLRPLFFEFPQDTRTYYYDRQFLVGPSLLISPVLTEFERNVDAYFPVGRWYDWYNHQITIDTPLSNKEGKWLRLSGSLERVNVHMRGGFIVPTQKPALTTAAARLNPYELLVPLDENKSASGNLFIDDGISHPINDQSFSYISFSCFAVGDDRYRFSASGVFNYLNASVVDKIYIIGLFQERPVKVYTGDGHVLPQDQWTFDQFNSELVLLNLKQSLNSEFSFEWTTEKVK